MMVNSPTSDTRVGAAEYDERRSGAPPVDTCDGRPKENCFAQSSCGNGHVHVQWVVVIFCRRHTHFIHFIRPIIFLGWNLSPLFDPHGINIKQIL